MQGLIAELISLSIFYPRGNFAIILKNFLDNLEFRLVSNIGYEVLCSGYYAPTARLRLFGENYPKVNTRLSEHSHQAVFSKRA